MKDFARLYEKNHPIVCRYLLSLCRGPSLAEELTQDAFEKALEHFEQFDWQCQF